MAHSSILVNWISNLPYRQQAALLMSLRNCDIVGVDDPSRLIIHELRKVIFKTLIPVSDVDELAKENEDRDFRKTIVKLCANANKYPLNFYRTLMHSAMIIGYKCPELKTKKRWLDVYTRMVQKLNLHIESEKDIDVRLSD